MCERCSEESRFGYVVLPGILYEYCGDSNLSQSKNETMSEQFEQTKREYMIWYDGSDDSGKSDGKIEKPTIFI